MFSDSFHAQICETHTCCGPWVWSYHPDDERATYSYARWAQNPYSCWVDYNNYNWWLTAQKVILISQSNVILPRWFQSHLCWAARFREDFSVGWSFSVLYMYYIYISVSTGLELNILQLSKWDEHSVLWLKSQKSPALCRWFSIGWQWVMSIPMFDCWVVFWFFTPRMRVETVGVDRDSSWRR